MTRPLFARTEATPASRWHGLDPLTRLVVALGTVVSALLLGSVVCLAVLGILAVLLPTAIARELRPVLRLAVLLALPLGISAVLINVLFSPGTTSEGAWLAAGVVLRIVVMAGATVLFYRTTAPADLVGSLQHHGLSNHITFVIHNAVAMIPRLAERAREVTAAQRARGFDSEAGLLRRGRGIIALAAPTVLGAVAEVETRTLALETRAFTRPGRVTVLRPPRDSSLQRVGRWSIVVGLGALAMARFAGLLPC